MAAMALAAWRPLLLLLSNSAPVLASTACQCQWQLPYDPSLVHGQQAQLSSVPTVLGAATRRQVTLDAGSTLVATAWPSNRPEHAPRSDLVCSNRTADFAVVASASMFAGSGWWLNGGSWVYGRANASHAFLYWQRIDALGDLFEAAPIPTLSQVLLPTSRWPLPPPTPHVALGFVPPPLASNLTTRGPLTLGDALLLELPSSAASAAEQAAELVRMLDALLPHVAPPTRALPSDEWAATAERAVAALEGNSSSSTRLAWKGHSWLRSYVNDYRTVPELLTHCDVLEALVRWEAHAGKETQLGKDLRAGMATGVFFNEQVGVLLDWASGQLNAGSQGDTWYTIFTHIKFAHLALLGEDWARVQLLKSIPYVIRYARKMAYRFPVFFKYLSMERVHQGEGEHSDAMGYAYLMLQMAELTTAQGGGNASSGSAALYLSEAKAAHGAGGGRSFFNGSFTHLMYERPFPSLGCVALAKLANLTGDHSLYAEALRAEASMLPWITNYQAMHGYRGAVPSFMGLSAMSSSYSAAFETHQSLRYLDECLGLAAPHWPAAASRYFSEVIKHASGVARASYPDRIPGWAFAPIGCPTIFMGNVQCGLKVANASNNGWLNNKSVMVPVEDLVWESHRAQRDEHGALPLVGQVGQEIYGAGLAFDMALLQPRYGAATSIVAPTGEDGTATLQLFPRLLRCTPLSVPLSEQLEAEEAGGRANGGGCNLSLALHGAASAAVLASVEIELQGPPGIQLLPGGGDGDGGVAAGGAGSGGGRALVLVVDAAVARAAGTTELLCWLRVPSQPWRANRLVLQVS